jgi:serine/threonine protein kinase
MDLDEDFDVCGELGSGAFSVVRAAKLIENGSSYAIKSLNKSDQEESMNAIASEIEILRALKHDQISQLHRVYEDNDCVHLVLNRIHGENLLRFLLKNGTVSEVVAIGIAQQLFEVVEYVHCQNIMHRDIKIENIVIDENHLIHLLDFGHSAFVDPRNPYVTGVHGTPGYFAPEILRGEAYTYSADLFSIGVTLYILVIGQKPFAGNDMME